MGLGASALLALSPAEATEGSSQNGEAAYGVCVSCHGAHGEGRPALDGPRIGDLDAGYVVATLTAMRDGGFDLPADNASARSMQAVAENLDDEQIALLGQVVEGLNPELGSPTEAVEGGEKAWESCGSCHGDDARGNSALGAPDLLYQSPTYLSAQLRAYRDGVRGAAGSPPLAPAMAASVADMDDDTFELLVDHIGSLRPERPALDNPEVTLGEDEGLAAFADIYAVSMSPRCMNCHPAGDAPLQTDASTPHTMNVTRLSPTEGVHCSQCHAPSAVGDGTAPLPPADTIWSMPPSSMAFEGRSPAALCAQLKDPEANGGRGLTDLKDHVEQDHLLITSWHSGRTAPPLSHPELVERFETWGAAGGPCPE